MDLVTALNSPRLVRLAGETYWVRSFWLGDYATILAWLDDVIPGRPDRKMPPLLSSAEAGDALDSLHGRGLLTYLALRDQGVGFDRALELAGLAEEVEWARFLQVVHSRRRTRKPVLAGSGEDLAESWWGPLLCSLAEACHLTLEDAARLTLDQLEMYASKGCEDEDPRNMTPEEVEAMRLKFATEGQAHIDPRSGEEVV